MAPEEEEDAEPSQVVGVAVATATTKITMDVIVMANRWVNGKKKNALIAKKVTNHSRHPLPAVCTPPAGRWLPEGVEPEPPPHATGTALTCCSELPRKAVPVSDALFRSLCSRRTRRWPARSARRSGRPSWT